MVKVENAWLGFVLISLLTLSDTSFAQTLDANNPIDQIVIQFRDVAASWVGPLITIALNVFWALVLIDWILTFGVLALEGATLDAFAAAFVRRVIFVSFGLFVLQNPGFLVDLVNGFRDSATTATGFSGFAPSNFFDSGMILVSRIWDEFSIFDGDSWGLALVSIVILICISITAAWLVLTLVEMYIVMFGGVILLGFFGSNHTKEYAMRYFGYLFSVGMKLFVITLLAGLGISLLTAWVDNLGNGAASFLIMAGASVVMAALTIQIPNLVQSFISGVSGTDGMNALRTAGAIGGAAAGAAVGTTAAAAGGAMSVAEASKLAGSQGHTGMAKAGAMMRNLASSALGDVKGKMSGDISRQHGTMGARMAADMAGQRLAAGSKSNGNNSGSDKGGGAQGSSTSLAGSISAANEDGAGSGPSGAGKRTAAENLSGPLTGEYLSGAPGDEAELSAALNDNGQTNTTTSGADARDNGVSGSQPQGQNPAATKEEQSQTMTNKQSVTSTGAATPSSSATGSPTNTPPVSRSGETRTSTGNQAGISSGAQGVSSNPISSNDPVNPMTSDQGSVFPSSNDGGVMGESLGGYRNASDPVETTASNAKSGGVSDKSSDDILRMRNQELKDKLRAEKDKKK